MAKGLKKAMSYLGFVEDGQDEYDEYAEVYEDEPGYGGSDDKDEVISINRRDSKSTNKPQKQRKMEKIITVHPKKYNDAVVIGQAFRDGIPVIINLYDLSEADGKRIVDFSSGLTYGLYGKIKNIAQKVWLLTPKNVLIADEEDATIDVDDDGFYNQS